MSNRAPIDQPFSRESSPNPNLASDRAAQQVCDHSHSVRGHAVCSHSTHLASVNWHCC